MIRYLHSTVRIPHIELEEFEEKRKKNLISPDELDILARLSHNGYRLHLLIAIYTVYSLKNIYFVYSWFHIHDRWEPANDVQKFEDHLRLCCIHTNCSIPLAGSRDVADGLSMLPLIENCYPKLASFYPPNKSIGNYGAFMFPIAAFSTILVGIIIPLYCIYHPTKFEFILFAVAPNDVIQTTLARLKNHQEAFAYSIQNFCRITLEKKWRRGLETNHPLLVIQPPVQDQDRAVEQLNYQLDCLPSVRSYWWRESLAKFFTFGTLVSLGITLFLCAVIMTSIELGIREKEAYLLSCSKEVREANCSIWADGIAETDRVSPGLDILGVNNWSLYSLFESLSLVLSLACTILWLISYLYIIILEVNYWLAEIKFQVLIATEIIELNGHPNNSGSSDAQSFFDMSIVRKEFIANTNLISTAFLINNHIAGSDLTPKIKRQQFVLSLMKAKKCDRNSIVEYLSKTYINLSLLNDYPRHLKAVAPILLITVYGINYGILLMSLWFSKGVRDFVLVPQITCLIAWLFTNVPLLLVSSFHARVSFRPNLRR